MKWFCMLLDSAAGMTLVLSSAIINEVSNHASYVCTPRLLILSAVPARFPARYPRLLFLWVRIAGGKGASIRAVEEGSPLRFWKPA
ncbi:hypothetical protein SAMN05216387_10516 [Nitrosovibrio tenuis]|uniref:Uncharacterized protein n=1 Tax=Nitrosovibrio tenuis TaxID=1233 RepID=A0A1H7MC35_9PROT|nr:hypothetical protein SAMN05216387_10516 [Nitrosovibrio tenuis]